LVLPIEGIYGICLWVGFICHDILTKFNKDWWLEILRGCNLGIITG
jgi:hypothetical protein